MKMHHILLAEDEPNLGSLLQEYLQAKGYEVTWAKDGKEAYELFSKHKFSLCILDVMMPNKDGFTLAAELKKLNEQLPVLFLTSKSGKEDVIKGFKLGADDYVTKPFSMEELLLRIEAILRRYHLTENTAATTRYKIGKYTFDYDRQLLSGIGDDKRLSTKESELLKLLCTNKNKVLERTVALQLVWNDDSYFNGRSMDVYITKLRKYLKDDPSVEIQNIHGLGFKMVF